MKLLSIKYLCSTCVLFLAFSPISAQKPRVDEYLLGLIRSGEVSGLSVAVIKGNKLIYSENYGFADLKSRTVITDGTQFGIMSITKPFVACAVMQLANRKMIDINAPVRKYLDYLPKEYDKVLVSQLLNHTSGVPDYVESLDYFAKANRTQTPLQVIQPVIGKPLSFVPGTRSSYSNSGYFLLGLTIEAVTKESLATYLQTHIFFPAGMTSTFLDEGSKRTPLRAKGYAVGNSGLAEVSPLNPSQYWAAGGIVTTKADLVRWNSVLFQGTILPSETLALMMQPTKLLDGSNTEFGLGFELMSTPGMKIAGSNGSGVGFNAAYLNFLSDGLTVIVLTNTSGSNSSRIAKSIRDILIGQTENNAVSPPSGSNNDKLDSTVEQLIVDARKGAVNKSLFRDPETYDIFCNETLSFIQSLGSYKSLERKGEKQNPESVVRRYQVRFENVLTNWIFIFSNDGKFVMINHM